MRRGLQQLLVRVVDAADAVESELGGSLVVRFGTVVLGDELLQFLHS